MKPVDETKPEEEIAERTALEAQERMQHVRQQCQSLSVTTEDGRQRAGKWLVAAKIRRKEIEEKRDGITKPLHLAHKNAIAFFRPPLETVDQAIQIINRKLIDYEDGLKKIADNLINEAREKARKEFEEKKRKAAEEAAAAEKAGDRETAADIRDAVPSRPDPVAAIATTPPPVTPGLGRRTTWRARVVDAAKVPHEFRKCDPDLPLLNAYARSHEANGRLAGVEFFPDTAAVKRGQS